MITKLIELKKILDNIDKFCVYGTGEYSSWLCYVLSKLDILDKIEFFVTSYLANRTEKQHIYGNIEVKEICNGNMEGNTLVISRDGVPFFERQILPVRNIKDKNLTVVVATDKKNAKIIEPILAQKGITRVVYFHEYVFSESLRGKYFYRSYISSDENQLCEYVASRLFLKPELNNTSYEFAVLDIKNKWNELKRSAIDKKKIVFIGEYIKARTIRIAIELKRNGFEIEFVRGKSSKYISMERLVSSGIAIHECSCIEDILYHMMLQKRCIVFTDLCGIDASVAAVISKYKSAFGKVIFAGYDVCTGDIAVDESYMYDAERYAFKHSDGVVWRFFSRDYLIDNFGIEIDGKEIQFLDCCDERNLSWDHDRNGLSICCVMECVGNVLKDTNDKKIIEPIQNVLSILDNYKNITFHLYALRTSQKEENELIELKKRYKGFDYFISIKHEDLMKRLEEYDYAFEIMSEDSCLEWPLYDYAEEYNVGYYRADYIYAVANRLFEYLSAGVPIVTTCFHELCKVLGEDVVVPMSIDNLDMDYLIKEKARYKKGALNNRRRFFIKDRIDELIRFINDL